jgi:hypothetical protein
MAKHLEVMRDVNQLRLQEPGEIAHVPETGAQALSDPSAVGVRDRSEEAAR